MKTIISVFSAIAFVTGAYGQQIISTKGDKIPLTDLAIEPWNIENTPDKASSNTQNIYQNGKVGIGNFAGKTINKQLEVEGDFQTQKLHVPGIAPASATTYSNVGIDLTTGELVKFNNVSHSKPYNYITYTVTTQRGEDFIKDLDTKIPSNEYTVLLINAILEGDATISLNNGYFPALNYSATVANGTWHLSADYVAGDVAGPLDKSKTYSWKLVCLVVQNTQINDLGTASGTLNSDDTGVLATPIRGL